MRGVDTYEVALKQSAGVPKLTLDHIANAYSPNAITGDQIPRYGVPGCEGNTDSEPLIWNGPLTSDVGADEIALDQVSS